MHAPSRSVTGPRFLRLAAATMVCGLVAPAAPAGAEPQPSSVMELGGQRLSVTPQEMKALSALGNLVRGGGQTAGLDRALEEARRVANGRDARHVLAVYELEIANRRGDTAMRAKALDVLIASDLTARDKLPGYLAARGQIAYKAGDFDTAGRLWSRWAELAPSDPDALANLAQVRLAQKDAAQAMDLLTRAIAAREAAGQTVSDIWFRQRLSIAQQGHLVEPGIAAARALVGAYPTPENWRAALVVYRQLAAPEGGLEIDLLRLTRHAGAFAQAAEYQRMAQLLRQSGEAKEAKSVLDEGVGRGLLDAGTSPTREIMAEVDRALAKGRNGAAEAPDKAGAQVRLGMARLAAGQRSEAEAAFRAGAADPASGRYADLAYFWLASLAKAPSAP